MKKPSRPKATTRLLKPRKGLFAKLPPAMAKKLGILLLLVIVLPALALAAQLATQLYSKAYLPPSPAALCKEALKTHKFGDKCNTTVTRPTRGTDQKMIAEPTKVASYTGISFTCIDGYTGNYPTAKGSCVSEVSLLNYAYSACSQHSLVKMSQVAQPCRIPTKERNNENYQKTYKQLNYTCGDGFVAKYTSRSCLSETSLKAKALSACRNHSICKPVTQQTCNAKVACPTGYTCQYPDSGSRGTAVAESGKCVPAKTPTRTPTTSTNVAPTISTTSLPGGYVGKVYNASVRAIDQNQEDSLKLIFSGLPSGLRAGPCAVPAGSPTQGVSLPTIECYISGTPTTPGKFLITATVTDSKGSTAVKQLPLYINTTTTTPYPTRVYDPNKY